MAKRYHKTWFSNKQKKVNKLSAVFFLFWEIKFLEETNRSTEKRPHSSKIKKHVCQVNIFRKCSEIHCFVL